MDACATPPIPTSRHVDDILRMELYGISYVYLMDQRQRSLVQKSKLESVQNELQKVQESLKGAREANVRQSHEIYTKLKRAEVREESKKRKSSVRTDTRHKQVVAELRANLKARVS